MERRIRRGAQKASLSTASDLACGFDGAADRGSLTPMRSYWPLMLLLAAMWGASYLFIKVAVDDIPPAAMTELRVSIAGLAPLRATSPGAWDDRGPSRSCAPLAAVPRARGDQCRRADGSRRVGRDAHRLERRRNRAVDGADLHVPSRRALPAARTRGPVRIAGVALGFDGSRASLPGSTRRRMVGDRRHARRRSLVALVRRRRRLRAAAGSRHPRAGARDGEHAGRGARARPTGDRRIRRPPSRDRPRSPASSASFSFPTFAGQLLLFRVLHLFGSRKLSIVTYLMPAFAVVYGAVLLDEPVTDSGSCRLRADPPRRGACVRPATLRHEGAGVGGVTLSIRARRLTTPTSSWSS